jgi:hypothetical protein
LGIPDWRRKTNALALKLSEAVGAKKLGCFTALPTIPENAAIVFYGGDSEALFQALDPIMKGDPIRAGASVALRQGDRSSGLALPGESNRPN